jgi:hypothetical protein
LEKLRVSGLAAAIRFAPAAGAATWHCIKASNTPNTTRFFADITPAFLRPARRCKSKTQKLPEPFCFPIGTKNPYAWPAIAVNNNQNDEQIGR